MDKLLKNTCQRLNFFIKVAGYRTTALLEINSSTRKWAPDWYTAWKVSKYGIFSGPYFPAFGLNTERYFACSERNKTLRLALVFIIESCIVAQLNVSIFKLVHLYQSLQVSNQVAFINCFHWWHCSQKPILTFMRLYINPLCYIFSFTNAGSKFRQAGKIVSSIQKTCLVDKMESVVTQKLCSPNFWWIYKYYSQQRLIC